MRQVLYLLALLALSGCAHVELNTVSNKTDCSKKNQLKCTYDGYNECCDQINDNDVSIKVTP